MSQNNLLSPLKVLPTNRTEGSNGIPSKTNNDNESPSEKAFTNLELEDSPELFPWRVNVKLFIEAANGTHFVCSGTLIDAYHVITAGHCVYLHDEGGWANSITVIPGYQDGISPYGQATSNSFTSFTGWINNAEWENDMAIIKLDRPVGSIVGWFGYGYNTDNNFFFTPTFHTAGYPGASPYNGAYLYYRYGDFDSATPYILYSNNVSYGGQSGSGTYWKDTNTGSRYVYAVLSHGNNVTTGQTRVTANKFNVITDQVNSNISSNFDMVPLYTRSTPSSVNAGDILSSFEFYVYNNSLTAFSGSMTAKIYLSSDLNITTSDVLLGSLNFSNLTVGGKQTNNLYANPGAQPVIPANTTSGGYYIGVQLDIQDGNTLNNISGIEDVSQVYVNQLPTGLAATCADALTLSIPGTYYSDGPFSGNGCFNCSGATHADWYVFSPPSNGLVNVKSCGYGEDTRLWVYEADGCWNLSLITSSDDDCEMANGSSAYASQILDIPVQVGKYYYLEWDNAWSENSFNFDIEFEASASSFLDCNALIQLTPGLTYFGNTSIGQTNASIYNCGFITENGKEVIHSITATQSGQATFQFTETALGFIDLYLLNDCDPNSSIACWLGIDNISSGFNVVAGEIYYFVTEVYGTGNGGDYSLTVNMPVSSLPDWDFQATGSNHTIIVPSNLVSNISGQPLSPGDYIGLFYTYNGSQYCAGYGKWTGGETISFPVFGNDAASPNKNGFAAGETFNLKIWRTAQQAAFDVQATYTPPDGNLITNTNKYAEDGISQLQSLDGSSTLYINLAEGWNIISSNMIPTTPNMEDIFAGIQDKIVIVKDGSGNAYFPNIVNNIGNWSVTKGYHVKASANTTLAVAGQKVDPVATPIPLATGWQTIAYLRDNPSPPATQFGSIGLSIIQVKNAQGQSYIPSLPPPANTLTSLLPSQGYKVKASVPTTLVYAANFLPGEPIEDRAGIFEPRFFDINDINTGVNATLIVPLNVAEKGLQLGDEIGIFSQDGILCGAVSYNEQAFIITIWGDDLTTADKKEGLAEGETFYAKLIRADCREEFLLQMELVSSGPIYRQDEIYVVKNLVYPFVERKGQPAVFFQPNPVSNNLRLIINAEQASEVLLTLSSRDGAWQKEIFKGEINNGILEHEISVANITPGLYFCTARFDDHVLTYRIVVQH